MTKVSVYQEHIRALDGKRRGQVGRDVSLTGTGIEGSDDDYRGLGSAGNELQVGTAYSESLVCSVTLVMHNHK